MATFDKGQDVYGFFKDQTALDTPALPVAGDAIRVLGITITPTETRQPIADYKGHNSRVDQFRGRRMANVEVRGYVRPPAAGSEPQMGGLIESVLGKTVAVVAGTSATYEFQTAKTSRISGIHKKTTLGHEFATGCIFNQLVYTFENDQPVMFTATGMARDSGTMSAATLSSVTGQTITLSSGHGDRVSVGSYIKIGSAGSALLVTSKTGDVLTVTGTVPPTPPSTDILSALPTPSYPQDNEPIYATTGQLTIAGQVAPVGWTGGTTTITNGLALYTEDALTPVATDVDDTAYQVVRTDLNFNLTSDNSGFVERAKNAIRTPVIAQLGATAGRILTLSMGQLEFDPAGITTPDEGKSTYGLSGQAFATTAANDEISIVHT